MYSAVVFADGNAQGSNAEVAFIRAKRLGRMIETERVRGIFDALLIEQELGNTSIEALNAKLGNLPNSPAEAFASVGEVHLPGSNMDSIKSAEKRVLDGFLLGIRAARQDALWKVSQLAQLPASAASATQQAAFLFELRQLYRDLSAKNRALLNSRGDRL